jgi:hypothetical protein
LEELLSKPIVRVTCDYCGEEIINEREVAADGAVLCRTCANEGYYLIKSSPAEMCAIMEQTSVILSDQRERRIPPQSGGDPSLCSG